jgi:hypothetical protein
MGRRLRDFSGKNLDSIRDAITNGTRRETDGTGRDVAYGGMLRVQTLQQKSKGLLGHPASVRRFRRQELQETPDVHPLDGLDGRHGRGRRTVLVPSRTGGIVPVPPSPFLLPSCHHQVVQGDVGGGPGSVRLRGVRVCAQVVHGEDGG